jgi:hypothetical protein
MKSIIIYLIMGFTMLSAQDAAGQYKLSGVDVMYTFVTRDTVTLTVTDAYGMGITQAVAGIPAAVPFTTQAMQLTDAALSAVGINLNINLNDDGSGSVAEGSYYPDVNTIKDENGACVTLQQVLPVTDNFTYTSSGSMMADAGMVHPGVNVLGLPGISTRAGTAIGGFGLSGSFTFEDFSMIPIHPTLCDPSDATCYPFTVGDYDADGTVQVYPALNAYGFPEYVPGGFPLTGLSGGYFLKRGLNTDALTSVFPDNTEPDFILEWHGVDGKDSGLGLGDTDDDNIDLGDDDEDGTWFDRTLGIPGITATYMDPACGFTLPIYGDVTDAFTAVGLSSCIDTVDVAASGYLMDPSGALATWGNFLTANAATYAGTAATLTDLGTDPAGIMVACGATGAPTDQDAGACLTACAGDTDCNTACVSTCAAAAVAAYVTANNPNILVDDSDHDFDVTTNTGRLTMNFDIPCVPIIEAREVVAEFIEVGGEDEVAGCMDVDACNYDATATYDDNSCFHGQIEEDDSLAPCYAQIGQICTHDCDACCIEGDCTLYVDECGVCGGDGIDEGACDCDGNAVDCAGVCGGGAVETDCGCGETASDTTTGCCADGLGPNDEAQDCAGVCGGDDTSCLSIDEVTALDRYSITSVYPNPFNPVINISYGLPENSNIQLVMYDAGGNRIETLLNGFQTAGVHSISWDASSYPSGLYFIRLVGSGFSETQKVVLMK